jgi:hypothetical protein
MRFTRFRLWGSLLITLSLAAPCAPRAYGPGSEAPLDAFDAWRANHRVKIGTSAEAVSLAEGIALAQARRDALKALIISDPARAIARALSAPEREALPREVQPYLESRQSGRGSLEVLAGITDEVEPRPLVERYVSFGGRRYTAHVYGRGAGLHTHPDLSLHAVILDGEAALLDSPLRRLAAGERPDPGKRRAPPSCPVSGKRAGSNQEPDDGAEDILVESGDTIYPLCTETHQEMLERQLLGDPGWLPAAYNTIGTKNVLVIRVDFSDAIGASADVPTSTAAMATVGQFYNDNSFTQMSMVTTISANVYRMPQTGAYYVAGNFYDQLRADARAAAAADYTLANYQFDVMAFKSIGWGWSGLGYVGAAGAWIQGGFSFGVIAHEMGHNCGVWHANRWDATGDTIIGPGTHVEYGNAYDVMSTSGTTQKHFNGNFKQQFTWLTAALYHTATVSGIYRVVAEDSIGVLDPAKRYSLRVPTTGTQPGPTLGLPKDYWVDFRQQQTGNLLLMNGAELKFGSLSTLDQASRSLDMIPGSPSGMTDSALSVGRTFADTGAALYITPLYKNGTTPESLDVQVNFGPYPSNRAPVLALGASATTVATGVAVNFTATASDPDGDALAYYWTFADGTPSTNSATVSHSWAVAKEYVVYCTVSDMKGGTATKWIIITVGSPATFRINGSVTAAGASLLGARIIAGSSTYLGYTDSAGNFAVTALPAGSYSVSALAPGYTVTAQFTNPVVLGPNAANINFTATPVVYNVAGTVTSAGSPVANVLVSDSIRSTLTAANGTYTLTGLSNGTSTLTASRPGYGFVSSGWSNPVAINYGDLAGINFIDNPPTYNISGIFPGLTAATTVTVTNGKQTTTSYWQGNKQNYSLAGVRAGSWTLTAAAPGKSFTPSGWSNPVVISNASLTGRDFTLDAAQAFVIRGTVTDAGLGVAGVTVSTGANSAVTGAGGLYALAGMANGSYTLTATFAGFSFTPASRSATVSGADQAGLDFTVLASPTGRVPDSGTPLRAGKTSGGITLSWGAACSAAVTDYEIYAGTLAPGNFYNHAPLFCSSGGQTSIAFVPAAGNVYYLIVPRTGGAEGSYGFNGAGAEIPAGTTTCLPRVINGCS